MPTRFAFPYPAETRRLLRERIGRAHAVLAGRGAAAIWTALRALDLHDRAVLIPANTCYIVLWVILQSGNHPFLVDIDPLTGNITPQTLDSCAAERPAVLIPAHMYGLPAPMADLMTWARARGVFVIEDAALALGTPAAGSWGDASIFSFGAGKIADAGGGGALLTDDAALARDAERLLADLPLWTPEQERLNRQWLEIYWALHQFEAENPRLPALYPALFDIYGSITRCRLADAQPIHAALLRLDATLAQRADLAAFYDLRLAVAPVRLLPRLAETILWRYPLLVPRDQRRPLLEALWSAGILDATRWYPSLQPMRAALAPALPITPTPAADQFAAEIVNLPLAPDTDREIAARAAEVVLGFFGGA